MNARLAGIALAVTLTLTVAACAVRVSDPPDPSDPAASAGSVPAGVEVELRQSRADVAARQATVTVHNGGAHPLEVGAVSVADERFVTPAERVVERSSVIPRGATVDVRVQLGEVNCDADAAEARATLTLHYTSGGGAQVAVVPITDAVPFIADLHLRECVQQRALRSASIEFADFTPSPPGEPATLQLAVVPTTATGELRIVGIRETNLLTFDPVSAGIHPLDIDQTGDGRAPVTVDLPLLPARCDAHAVQEDKRGTVFRLFVETGTDEGSFDLVASPELRGRILGWISEWCEFGSR